VLPIHKLIWHESRARERPIRVPEPSEAMEDSEQIRAYVKAYEWGGPTSALQLYHLRQLATLIRPGDTVLDLACGPGPLLLELAPLYPQCRFIGADLSRPMLAVLEESAATRGLGNVQTLCADIRQLPSLGERSVDVIISTSALHHLPDLDSLRQTLIRSESLLTSDGGLYLFDFGLVRSQATRDLLVADVARRAPAITAVDYAHSLRAAFPIADVVALARQHLKRELVITGSRFVDFFYFIRTGERCRPSPGTVAEIDRIARRCGVQTQVETAMLNRLQRAL
jgi:arsenite methyltransferase